MLFTAIAEKIEKRSRWEHRGEAAGLYWRGIVVPIKIIPPPPPPMISPRRPQHLVSSQHSRLNHEGVHVFPWFGKAFLSISSRAPTKAKVRKPVSLKQRPLRSHQLGIEQFRIAITRVQTCVVIGPHCCIPLLRKRETITAPSGRLSPIEKWKKKSATSLKISKETCFFSFC